MQPSLRAFEDRDRTAVVALSLLAWAPVFTSLENALGDPEVYTHLHPDWRAGQQRAVEAACSSEEINVWVAEIDGGVVGFIAVSLDAEASIGEVHMEAVDPAYQRNGTGSLLMAFALDWIRGSGMAVAMVETGGDPGHAAARRTYERAGFSPLPITRYFKKL